MIFAAQTLLFALSKHSQYNKKSNLITEVNECRFTEVSSNNKQIYVPTQHKFAIFVLFVLRPPSFIFRVSKNNVQSFVRWHKRFLSALKLFLRVYAGSVIWARLHTLSRWNFYVIFQHYFSVIHTIISNTQSYSSAMFSPCMMNTTEAHDNMKNYLNLSSTSRLQMALTAVACFHWQPC